MTGTSVDMYEVLQVSPRATQEMIQAAYRLLARQYHPDYTAGDESKLRRMMEVNAAYAVLRDPVRRACYDAERAWTARGARSRPTDTRSPSSGPAASAGTGPRPSTPGSVGPRTSGPSSSQVPPSAYQQTVRPRQEPRRPSAEPTVSRFAETAAVAPRALSANHVKQAVTLTGIVLGLLAVLIVGLYLFITSLDDQPQYYFNSQGAPDSLAAPVASGATISHTTLA